ncbi:MAG: MFS transporter, partial [Alphaproteobacteria bacterium]
MRSPRPCLIALLTAITSSGPVVTSIYLLSLPAMAYCLEDGLVNTQLTLTVFLIGFAAAHLIYGPLADLYGRRPVLIAGLVLFTIASAACALAPDIELLIAARLLQSVGACAGPVIGRAVVRDLFERD